MGGEREGGGGKGEGERKGGEEGGKGRREGEEKGEKEQEREGERGRERVCVWLRPAAARTAGKNGVIYMNRNQIASKNSFLSRSLSGTPRSAPPSYEEVPGFLSCAQLTSF